MIKITCVNCGKKLEAPDESAGKKGKCSFCFSIFEVPQSAAAAKDDADLKQDPDAPESEFGVEFTRKIIKAIENLEEARKYKAVGGKINRDLALKLQSMMQGSMYPKDILKDVKRIIREQDKGSDVFVKRMKIVMECLNDLKRGGKGEEEIKKEWERLARAGWRKRISEMKDDAKARVKE